MTTSRYSLNVPVYMPLDGQWQICYPGTVFDVPDTTNVHTSTATKLSPSESAGTLNARAPPTSVRNVRTR